MAFGTVTDFTSLVQLILCLHKLINPTEQVFETTALKATKRFNVNRLTKQSFFAIIRSYSALFFAVF